MRCRFLSLEDAQSGVLTELRHYARVAWTFLNSAGHINFGVAPAIAKRALAAPQERGSVIIVGAGLAGGCCFSPCLLVCLLPVAARHALCHTAAGTAHPLGGPCAGLAAARQLRAFGFKVVVLEGHGRPGGRVYTKQLQVLADCTLTPAPCCLGPSNTHSARRMQA